MSAHTPKNEKAVPATTDTAKDAAHAANSITDHSDTITILETLGPNLTKTYTEDGKTLPYGNAASFHFKEVQVSGLRGMATLLGKLHDKPRRCLVRGKYVGDDKAEAGLEPGSFARNNANLEDQPLHWFMIDVDGYKPSFEDPVQEPELAVLAFLEDCLPPCFRTASFYWHLSSSAGMPGKEGVLKCHLHFWSKTAYTTAQMHAWAKQVGTAIDSAVYRRAQVHYTADPIFRTGRIDPVPVRCGWHQGETDEVDLRIGSTALALARDQGSGTGGDDMKLVDPSAKDGLIGAFHEAFDAEQVLLEFLEGEFEQVSQRRYTWLNGGGTPEGVWVHDDGMHVGSSHNTWPIDGIANLWDLVRVFKFGDLDTVVEETLEDVASSQVGSRPSDLAMKAWAAELPELKQHVAAVQEAQSRERHAALEDWRARIQAAPDEFAIREVLCKQIATDDRLTSPHREALAVDVNAKLGRLTGNKPGIGHAKKLIAPLPDTRNVRQEEGGPPWLKGWYYVTDRDRFFRYDSDEWLTAQGFNAKYTRKVPPNDEGKRVPAAVIALEAAHPIPTVTRGMYLPGFEPIFSEDGTKCVNTYRPSSVPKAADKLGNEGAAIVDLVRRHLLALFNGREWLTDLLLDWVAHNVQKPGVKIRFSFVVQGIEGDGKSLIGELIGRIMGQANVRIISPEVICKSDFNGWAEGACVGVLEELRLQGNNRFDVLNSIKPSIANPTIPIHRKGKDPYNAPNTMNYIAFTNHKDALPLDDMDRRWVVVFAPWENISQFAQKVGCASEEYFDRLFSALDDGVGYLRRYFLDRDLSCFNRNARALDTDEKRVMVSLGVSDELSTAKELIKKGGYGFGPEAVSTRELTRAMVAAGIDAPRSTSLNRMMNKLGFHQFEEQVKWDGYPHRVWTRQPVTDKEAIRRLLDATAAQLVDSDFDD